MTARIFTVLSAILLVTAVGIAALTQLGLTLAQGLLMMEPTSLDWLQSHSSTWILNNIEKPFLLRPLWLLPASLGVICAGVAASFNLGKASPSRRRRS